MQAIKGVALVSVLACVSLTSVHGAVQGSGTAAAASRDAQAATPTTATAYATVSSCKMTAGMDSNGTAWANFTDSIALTGWSRLELWAPVDGEGLSDASLAAARAAGCVEGWLTQERIWQMVSNAKANLFPGGSLPTEAVVYLDAQVAWARLGAGAAGNGTSTEQVWWRQMAHLLAQFDGLVEGYNAAAPAGQNISALDLYALSSGGDLQTLQELMGEAGNANRRDMPTPRYGHCSALVRVLSSGDVAVGHTTWASYWQMLRMYKILHLGWAPGSPISMSSYPGTLSSSDDWYAMGGTGLVVTETTNDIFNRSLLWDAVNPLAGLVWQRAMIASQAAASGAAWSALFATHNSGTVPNQWMVLDSKQEGSSTGLLWVAEQIPGLVHSEDMTTKLTQDGWWGSWNIPYFTDVYNRSGYPAMAEKYGPQYSHDNCARARIYSRDCDSIATVGDMQTFLRYNNYTADPLSNGNPMWAVASRGDLASPPQAFGGYDTKVMTLRDAASGGSLFVSAISGPTSQGLKPFSWCAGQFPNTSHVGLPSTFDFSWTSFSPSGNKP